MCLSLSLSLSLYIYIYIYIRRAFAQGVSDHELGAFVSTIVSTLVSMFALVFAATVNMMFEMFMNLIKMFILSAIHSVWCNTFDSSSLFFARISHSASTLARTTVSCWKSAHARLLLREPPDLRIGACLTLAGHPFLKHFCKRLFSHKYHILNQN